MKRLTADIWDGLRFQPGRTALSMLAVCVGMTALTILLSVIGGLKQRSKVLLNEMGANVFVILPGQETEAVDARLTLRKQAVLQSSLDTVIVSAVRTFNIRVTNMAQPVRVFAADDNYFKIHNWSLKSGRMIDQVDQKNAARCAVVTDTLAYEANWQLGQVVYLGSSLFTVVGIVERPGAALEGETSVTEFVPNNLTLFVPVSSSSGWMSEDDLRAGRVDLIEVKVGNAADLNPTVAAAKRILAGRTEIESYTWITPDFVLKNIRRLEKIIGLTAGSVAFLCLILGGTTLMSLMVANVRDRVPEIALRRTLGATRKDIAALFLLEACFLTLTASLLGILCAYLLITVSRGSSYVPVYLGPAIFGLPLLGAVLLGMVFAYLPVRMAMAITPAEALRND